MKHGLDKINHKRIVVIIAAVLILLVAIMHGINSGSLAYSPVEILNLLIGKEGDSLMRQAVYNIRIPRILTGLFVGMNLAVAGVLLQGMLRNPMASANVIGVNSGAAFAAVIVMTIIPDNVSYLPVSAFVGALLTALIIYSLAGVSGRNSTVYIILAGIAVSNLLKALTSGLMLVFSDSLDITYSWLMGTLSGKTWTAVNIIWPYSTVALIAALALSPKLNILQLGDEVAQSMGVNTERCRLLIIVVAAVLAGSAVSVAGTIGFVGLIAPHTARLIIGNDHRFLIPLSALGGAILLIFSDTIARTIFQPLELAVGIITAVLGAPFFLFLLYYKKSQISSR